MKRCSKCKEEKPESEFYSDKSKKDGLTIACRKCSNEYSNKYCIRNTEKVRAYHKEYNKLHYINNKGNSEYNYNPEMSREYYIKNKEKIRKYQQKKRHDTPYSKIKYASDESFRLLVKLRTRVKSAINAKNSTKLYKTIQLIGCTIPELITHLKSTMPVGMTWEDAQNGKLVHIDHIRPCSSFDLTDPKQQLECFHYTNMQLLWAVDNLKKGDTWFPIS